MQKDLCVMLVRNKTANCAAKLQIYLLTTSWWGKIAILSALFRTDAPSAPIWGSKPGALGKMSPLALGRSGPLELRDSSLGVDRTRA
jgi:hypothetical protein